MEDPLVLLVVAGAALLGFTVAGVAGIGGGIITLPALIWAIGARDAITALAFTQILAAAGRMYFNWRDISWPVVRWFCLGAIPAVVAGSLVFIATPSDILPRLLGRIILLVVLFRHTPWGKRRVTAILRYSSASGRWWRWRRRARPGALKCRAAWTCTLSATGAYLCAVATATVHLAAGRFNAWPVRAMWVTLRTRSCLAPAVATSVRR